MLDLGWNYILKNSKEINKSFEKIYHLMESYEVYILTKVNSIQEKNIKTLFFKKRNVLNVICVPYNKSKIDYVDPYNNILIDDDISNLEEWEQKGGISVLFNENIINEDSYGNKNNSFIIIDDLLKICYIIKYK